MLHTLTNTFTFGTHPELFYRLVVTVCTHFGMKQIIQFIKTSEFDTTTFIIISIAICVLTNHKYLESFRPVLITSRSYFSYNIVPLVRCGGLLYTALLLSSYATYYYVIFDQCVVCTQVATMCNRLIENVYRFLVCTWHMRSNIGHNIFVVV